MARYLVPLVVFVLLAGFLYMGLQNSDKVRDVPSPLIDKPAPLFQLSQLHAADKAIATQDMKGQVWLFNVWASWCVSCRQEHPLLVQLARAGIVPIVGLNYKDKREDAIGWLNELGNPYTVSAFDADGKVGIDYGVYGVPETYVIDKQGIIRHKHIGPITPEALDTEILPLVRKLQG